jgi:hypothetical protein
MSSLGFVSNNHDFAFFVKCIYPARIILFLYVDDMIITSDDIDGISVLKVELSKQFKMKNLGFL